MTPQAFLKIIEAGAARLPQHDSPEARCMLLAIAGQESGWDERLQQPVAYARGFWQCEKTGATLAVLTSDRTKADIAAICNALRIPLSLDLVHEAVAWNDEVAYAVARLNLWLDPHPLPAIGDREGAWQTYVRSWRPGRPEPTRWAAIYGAASACFDEAPAPIAA